MADGWAYAPPHTPRAPPRSLGWTAAGWPGGVALGPLCRHAVADRRSVRGPSVTREPCGAGRQRYSESLHRTVHRPYDSAMHRVREIMPSCRNIL